MVYDRLNLYLKANLQKCQEHKGKIIPEHREGET